MRFARTIAAASVAGAALGLVPAVAASASSAARPGQAASSAARPGQAASSAAWPGQAARPSAAPVVIVDCTGQGTAAGYTRPRNLALSCDSTDILGRLRWTSWTAKGASGRGAEALNDCAQGKYHEYPVHVRFWGLAAVKGHHGEHRYTHYALTYSKAVPPGIGRTRNGTFAS